MLRRAAIVRTDVSEELSTYIIRVSRIGELGTLAVTRIRSVRRLTVTANVVPTRATRRNIPEDAILHNCIGIQLFLSV
jgi:hypothetical protein